MRILAFLIFVISISQFTSCATERTPELKYVPVTVTKIDTLERWDIRCVCMQHQIWVTLEDENKESWPVEWILGKPVKKGDKGWTTIPR